MIQFVFCHGFGFNIHFWDNLAPYFSQEKCYFIDLGYFKHLTTLPHFQAPKIVGVGHSLGLLKLIHMSKNFDYLIGLNSFVNFLGRSPTLHTIRQRELAILQSNFIKNPYHTLKNFYKRCGLSDDIMQYRSSDLDRNLLLSDFELLKQSGDLPLVPTLILTSNDDVIVPKEIIDDNFSTCPQVQIEVIRDAHHALGFKKPLEVYEKIIRFLEVNHVQ